MPTQVLAPTLSAGESSDITVTNRTTIAAYAALNDGITLEAGGQLLLANGTDQVLMAAQGGDALDPQTFIEVRIKDPLGTYQPSGKALSRAAPVLELGPGVYQVVKPATSAAIGIQTDAAS